MIKSLNDKTFDKYLRDDMPMLVMFHAAFSGPCNLAKPEFEAAAQRAGNQYRFCEFDLDGNPDVPSHWNVRAIPLFVHFENGTLVSMTAGALTTDQILGLLPNE